jgi:hypothetical protein
MTTIKKPIKKAQKGTNLKKDVKTVAIDNTRVKKLPTVSEIKSGEKILTAKKNKNYEESLKNKAAQKRKEANNAKLLSIELMMSDNNFNRSKLADKLTSERKKSADSLENLAKKNKTNPKYKPAFKNGGNVKAKDGKWMQKAAASIKKRGTAGKCTPITKPGCTGKAKALAKTFKKISKKNKK